MSVRVPNAPARPRALSDELKFALCVVAALLVLGLFVLSFHL